MKFVLCPYGHKNESGTRFCTTCGAAIPPDPTEVDEESEVDPKPVPVKPPEDEIKEGGHLEASVASETPPAQALPPGKICPNGHWNPPDQERWCRVCAEPLYEEPEPIPDVPRSRLSPVVLGGGLVALVVVGFVGLRLLNGGDETSDVSTTVSAVVVTTTTQAATTTTVQTMPLPPTAITVTASSEQPNGENFAINILDGLADTAWGHCGFECSGADGVGEFVRFNFDREYVVVSFDIINGYDKIVADQDRWAQNNRVQAMTVTADGGQSQTVTLSDARTVQAIELDFDQPTTSIQFTIDAVYQGNRFNDVSISEVNFTVIEPAS